MLEYVACAVVGIFLLSNGLRIVNDLRTRRELQVLIVLLDGKRLSLAEIIDRLTTWQIETGERAWPVQPVLRRLVRKGGIRLMIPRSKRQPPRWVIADTGRHRITMRMMKGEWPS